MKISLKRFFLTLIAILAVSVSFDLISTKFFDKSLVFKIVSKSTLILAVFYIIKKESFLSQSQKSICNYRIVYLILSLGLIGLSYYYLQSEITSLEVTIGKYQNLVFLLSCLAVGFFEELLFRAYAYRSIFNMQSSRKRIVKSILLTSGIFSIMHFMSFSSFHVYGVIIQVIFAFSFGILMQSIYIRTNSIVLVSSLHGLINYLGAYKTRLLPSATRLDIDSTYTSQDFLSSLISLLFITLIIVLISYVLIRKELAKETEEFENLNTIEI